MQVVAEADRRFARFLGFARFADFARRDRFGERPVLGRRDLDVRRVTVDELYRVTGAFDKGRLVGRVAALLAERKGVSENVAAERLWRLREEDRLARQRLGDGPGLRSG